MSDEAPSKGTKKRGSSLSAYVQNTILVGVLTAAPLVVTWFILHFLFDLIASAGRPAIKGLAQALTGVHPAWAQVLLQPAIQYALAVLVVVLALFLLGVFARQVIGESILHRINRMVDRIPLANKIYGPLRQLVSTLQRQPDGVQRVVLVEFPNSDVKAIGIVTRTMKDRHTGQDLAAVFIPTTPNPTAGYLEVVPVSRLQSLGMSMDDALSFVVSGGAVGPDVFNYSNGRPIAPIPPPPPPETKPETEE